MGGRVVTQGRPTPVAPSVVEQHAQRRALQVDGGRAVPVFSHLVHQALNQLARDVRHGAGGQRGPQLVGLGIGRQLRAAMGPQALGNLALELVWHQAHLKIRRGGRPGWRLFR